MQTHDPQRKQVEQAEIDQDIQKYLESGGEIVHIEYGMTVKQEKLDACNDWSDADVNQEDIDQDLFEQPDWHRQEVLRNEL